MVKTFFALILFLLSVNANALYRIAVIDSGVNTITSNICKDGNVSFVPNKTWYSDNYNHGNRVVDILEKNITRDDYCIVVYKVFDKDVDSKTASRYVVKALEKALEDKVDAVNLSLSGDEPLLLERLAINSLLKKNVLIVTASGNDGKTFTTTCKSFPACYDERIVVVGSLNKFGVTAKSSNVMPNRKNFIMFDGSHCFNEKDCSFGTSFAAPKALAFIINKVK